MVVSVNSIPCCDQVLAGWRQAIFGPASAETALSLNRTTSTDGELLDHCDPMTSQPIVEVGTTDTDNLDGDSDKGQAAMGSPVTDCACRDAADIGSSRVVIKDFG